MSAFKAEIYINPSLGSRYFGSVGIGQKLVVDVNPAFLSSVVDIPLPESKHSQSADILQ